MAKRMVLKEIITARATRTNYAQDGSKISHTTERVIVNPDHWREWAKTDRNFGGKVTVRTSVDYSIGKEILSSYTLRKPDGYKHQVKVIHDTAIKTGKYKEWPE